MSPAKIVFLGRLTPLKGGDHLIQAVAMASKRLAGKIQVIICGDGQPRAEYEAMARSLGVDVVFEGWVSPERREQILNAATLLGLPSLWPEPFGLVGLEAAVYSVPAVAYDVGGISEWLHDGVNGWLAPGDPPRVEGLAEAIEKALSDSARLQEAGRQALAMAKSMSLARHLDQLETILKGAAR